MSFNGCGSCNICGEDKDIQYYYPLPKELGWPIHWGLTLCSIHGKLLEQDITKFKEVYIAVPRYIRGGKRPSSQQED